MECVWQQEWPAMFVLWRLNVAQIWLVVRQKWQHACHLQSSALLTTEPARALLAAQKTDAYKFTLQAVLCR